MEGTITTADSSADGRLKVSAGIRAKKKSLLKNLIKNNDGRGGPTLKGFKQAGYGKVSFSSSNKISAPSFGGGKKSKKSAALTTLKSLLSKRTSKTKSFKLPKFKAIKSSAPKKGKVKMVKGLATVSM